MAIFFPRVNGYNKLEASFAQKIESEAANIKRSNSIPLVDRPLRIGYFGLLRDEWSWQVLESLAKAHPDKIEIVLAGLPLHPLENLPSFVEKHKNIQYIGQYKSPEDLPSLYNCVEYDMGLLSPVPTVRLESPLGKTQSVLPGLFIIHRKPPALPGDWQHLIVP